jgi:hypothetical protein
LLILALFGSVVVAVTVARDGDLVALQVLFLFFMKSETNSIQSY